MDTAERNPALFPPKPSKGFVIRAVCDWSLVLQQPGREKWVCRSQELHQVRCSLSPQLSWWRERPPWGWEESQLLHGLRRNTAGKHTNMWKNTVMEEKHRQENDLRVDTPLIQECIGCGGKSSLIKMKNSEVIWWFHYLRLHGKCMGKKDL